ncbi:hypothetical protein MKX01_019226 [Papaver californicum]|nr:hypothetical protein MKX01_019226 [Papaver californicum]
MIPFPNYYGSVDTWATNNSNHSVGYNLPHQQFNSSSTTMDMGSHDSNIHNGGMASTSSNSKSITDDQKALAACKSHSEAERRRRERINGHLATLRTLLPNTIKTDKASLLAEVVQHVKELKKIANGITGVNRDGDGCYNNNNNTTEWWPFPQETDELTLNYYCEASSSSSMDELLLSSSSLLLIRVSLSCDDRPDLMADLTLALKSVGAKVVKAEITTVGGRLKSILIIQSGVGGGVSGGGNGLGDLGTLRRALKAVLDKPSPSTSSSVSVGNMVVQGNNSKRPRFSRRLGSSSHSEL